MTYDLNRFIIMYESLRIFNADRGAEAQACECKRDGCLFDSHLGIKYLIF